MAIYLNKLELQGFKSFPERTLIRFHQGITAVVGPNGCGKSNLVDALLWVLGEQRIKNLRGDSNEDLIFSGSESKKALGMTEVGIYFDHGEETTYMGRRYFRNGESRYVLNERNCRNRDVQDALFNLGIGDRNYFIFEQGGIEKVVVAKPSEKRMLIEEAANIAHYLERKKETASKIVITQQNLENVEMILNEKQKRLKELKNQVAYARRYRETKALRGELLRTVLCRRFQGANSLFLERSKELEMSLEKESALVNALQRLEKEASEVEEQRWHWQRESKDRQQKLFNLSSRMASEGKESEKDQQGLDFCARRGREIQGFLAANNQEDADLSKRIKGQEKELLELEKKLVAGAEQVKRNSEEWRQLQQAKKELSNGQTSLQKELFVLQSERVRQGNELQRLEKIRIRAESELSGKKSLLESLRSSGLPEELKKLEKQIAELEPRVVEKENLFNEAAAEHDGMRRDIAALTAEKARLSDRLQNLADQENSYREIRDKLSGRRENDAGGPALQDKLQAESGDHLLLESFYRDEMNAPLLSADELLAAETGNCLLAVSRKEEAMSALASEPGCLGLVKQRFQAGDPQFKSCFRDGLIVENLASALRIHLKHGVETVTPEGVHINRFGLVFRGNSQGILDVMDDIRRIGIEHKKTEKELASLGKKGISLQEAENRAAAAAAARRKDWEETRAELLRLQAGKQAMAGEERLRRERLQVTEAEVEYLSGQQEKMGLEVEKMEKMLSEVDGRLTLAGGRKDEFDCQWRQMQEKINTAEKEKIQRESEEKAMREAMRTAQRFIADYRGRQEKLLTRSSELELEKQGMAGEVTAIKNRIAERTLKIKEMQREKSGLEKLVAESETRLAEIAEAERRVTRKLAEARAEIDRVREAKKEAEMEIITLKKDLFQLEETAYGELSLPLKAIEAEPGLAAEETEQLEKRLLDLEEKLRRSRENDRLNFAAESEYDLIEKEFNALQAQQEDILHSINDMHQAMERIDKESGEQFQAAFNSVQEGFRRNFRILFEGGEAELVLGEDDGGLEIKAQPPGKKLQSLRLLSGGEKTLTALAFLFSLFEYRPSPFCVFDEVDAALDEANVQRFLGFLSQMRNHTQFIIITHNFKTMERADYIYGITMDEPGVSRVYSIKLNQ